MKKALLLALVTIFSMSFSSPSKADTAYYLGGALNPTRCSLLAGSLGYPRYQFGGFVNGVYFWNACFGIKGDAPNPWGEVTVFDVLAYEDSRSCANDIEFRVEGVSCRTQTDRALQCKTKRQDINTVKDLIYKVKCVKDVKKG